MDFLFVYKLYRVETASKESLKNDTKLLNTIIKTTILAFMSTSLLIISAIINYSGGIEFGRSMYLDFAGSLIAIADLYSNFLSILLSYNYFDKWYNKMCGYCHSQCIQISIKVRNKESVVSSEDEKSTEKQIEMEIQ